MNKRGKIFAIIFVILVIIILGFFAFYYVSNSGPIKNLIIEGNGSLSVIEKNYTTTMFYSGMRFNHLPVSVYIEPSCGETKNKRIDSALGMLSEKTILTFIESSNKQEADIDIMCSSSSQGETKGYGTYIAGEGGPTETVFTGKFYIIRKGEISLYNTPTDCKSPNVEIHELLHVFGFEHSQDIESILYPYSRCDQQFTSDIINTINDIYSQKALPELILSNLSLNTYSKYAWRYADFEITIANVGMFAADSSVLKIYSANKLVDEFNVSALDYGSSSTLTVENMKIPKSSELKFVVYYLGEEFDKGNNEIVAKLSE